MYFYQVAVASLAHSKTAIFTYHSNEKLKTGTIVHVPLGKKWANGFTLGEVDKPPFETRPLEVLYGGTILPKELISLSLWLRDYYIAHIGTVIQTVLPSGIHKKRRGSKARQLVVKRPKQKIEATDSQKHAIKIINNTMEGAYLLRGVPGSGKTHVYIEAAKHVIEEGRSVIILIPEIALTSQLIADFSLYFENVHVTHSSMTEAERHQTWETLLLSDKPAVVIGPRSALFSPLKNVGLVVVDECHEPSFKQDRSPRYNALYAASVLTRLHQAKLIMGSATPNVTELYLAQQKKLKLLELPEAIFRHQDNEILIINHHDKDAFTKHRFLSNQLLAAIETSLQKKQQVLLFHNRRGTAPVVICEECGWRAECPVCHLPLTFHADSSELKCHSCNYRQPLTYTCPICHHPTIIFRGIGTKLITQEISRLFPKAKVARFDTDNTDDEKLHIRYQELYDNKIDILVGTQVVAKGLDLPKITTVGVVQADAGLHLPDYSASERTFQLLYQVSGRTGRSKERGTVIFQTYLPDHPIILWAAERNVEAFTEAELTNRQKTRYPPFRYLLKLNFGAKTEATTIRTMGKTADDIRTRFPDVEVLGPSPSFYEYTGGQYNWQLIIKSKSRQVLQKIAGDLPTTWQIDIDPITLL
ncbi:MAG TPA: primosomal protein N' [Candidatus Saccharimonadales bacterium]|nr:primosomal protein N' [Candidatus Saccharimonadales bacterium]